MQLKFSSFVIISVSFLASASAQSPNAEPKGHEFRAPGPGDVHGPCPGLNTLANHGYLPRNGKQFTVKTLLDAGLGLCDF
ncbi:Chloroperoxidase [Mycena olivaceomarginata]|nr:Chloroperoxidase [Mycena olivaceomarginata]